MNPVTTIKPNLRAIEAPELIRPLPGWLMWRYEHKEGEPKPRKVPYYTSGAKRNGVQGRPEDRAQLTTFDAARAAAMRKNMDGVGFALMPEWGITALDFDDCVAGAVHPSVLTMVAGTYAEFSPSGNGVRAFVRGSLGNYKDVSPERKEQYGFGFEVFSSKGFVTLTGNRLDMVDLAGDENTIAPAGEAVLAHCAARFGRTEASDPAAPSNVQPVGLTYTQLEAALDVLDPGMGYAHWLKVGMALHHETGGEGFDLWDSWSSGAGDKYPGSEHLAEKWDSFGRGGQRPVTAHFLVNLANEQGAHIDLSHLALADFDVIDTPAADPEQPGKFRFEPMGEFAERPAPAWIIKGVLPAADVALMIGESGAGKSFMALDMAGAIARGLEWRGLKTRQGRVLYIAAEGAGGFRNRVRAYCQEAGIEPGALDILVMAAAPNFLQSNDALAVAKAAKAVGPVALIVVDTFAQVTPGANENAGEDMGKALTAARGIGRVAGAPVLLVHHVGKDATKGARGWSGLKAAADAELEVSKTVTGRMLRSTKQKDGEDGLEWGFDIKRVTIGHDEDGDEITSCVVVEAQLPVKQQVAGIKRKLGKWESLVVAVIQEMAEAQTSGIELQAVIDAAVVREPKPEHGRDTRRQHASRALKRLCDDADSPYFVDGDSLSIG